MLDAHVVETDLRVLQYLLTTYEFLSLLRVREHFQECATKLGREFFIALAVIPQRRWCDRSFFVLGGFVTDRWTQFFAALYNPSAI